MCGIAGVFDTSGARFEQLDVLDAMSACLVHRGPDEDGLYVEGPIALGFRRLSVIDVPHGHQPMIDEASGVSLVFNGEIYNFRELRSRLQSRGHRFHTASDTETILHGYLEWGDRVVDELVGMFAFAIHDPRTGSLLLARDRLGIKPLYWAQLGTQFLFASEMKSIFAHPGFRKTPSLDGISSYLTFRQPVWNLSYFEGLEKVLPGHVVTVRAGEVRSREYWHLPVPDIDEQKSEQEWQEQADELLRKSIERCMVSEVPLGAYLSGGLDSSLIVAMMAQLTDQPIKTFSIGYGGGSYDEGRFAQAVAEAVGAEHRHMVLGQNEFRDGMVPLIVHRDAPLSIPQEVAVFKLSAAMKSEVTVALSGDGADELFGGYGRVMRSPLDWKKVRALRRLMPSSIASRIAGSVPRSQSSVLSNLDASSHLEHFYRMYNWVPFEEKHSLFSADALRALDGDRATRAPFEASFARTAQSDPYDEVLHAFQHLHIGAILDKVDSIGMAASLEGRVPFVDHELIETFIRMPVRHKMRWNSASSRLRSLTTPAFAASETLDTTKTLLRDVAARYLPPELAQRKKMGFPTPLDDWMRAGMLDYAKEILLDPSSRRRGIFDHTAMERFLSEPQSLDYDFYGKKVWMYMNVELWLQNVVDA